MLEPGRHPDFAEEPLGVHRGGQCVREDLDSDVAAVLPIVGEIDASHPTPTNLPVEVIPVRQRRAQAIELTGEHSARDTSRGVCRSARPALGKFSTIAPRANPDQSGG